MLRLLASMTLYLLSVEALAFSCEAHHPEDFSAFLQRFSDDKQFAIARTRFPVLSLRWESDPDENGEIKTRLVRSYVSKQQNAQAPTLGAYVEANSLTIETKMLTRQATEVKAFKPDSDWIVIFRFNRKGNCWYFTRYEDQSL